MGQTLPNGIYLPAEGERNCYDGLEGNWRSLDSLISTVAGKASATHTHGNITNDGKVGTTANLPLITGTGGAVQAGSFGNQANTFCEGNDSRLSDARTPVAHTHGNIANDGKLTNGNRVVITGSDKAITESSVTDTELGYVAGVTSAIQTQLNAKAADSDVVHKTGNESIEGVKSFLNTNIRFNSSSYVSGTPSVNIFYVPILIGGVVNNSEKNTFQHNAAIRTTGINDYSIRVYSQTSNTLTGVVTETNADASIINFRPIADGTHNLGTSLYKWKTLNGLNPGALSLPNSSAAIQLDTTGWNLTGATTISYTSAFDGWLELRCQDVAGDYLFATCSEYRLSVSGTGGITAASAGLALTIPVRANVSISIIVKASNKFRAYLTPCLGNV